MRKLAECVPKLANFEECLCFKFEEGLSLEIREKMSITGIQSYKEVVQLALRAEKLTCERMSQSNFQKMKGFGFMSSRSLKKSRSSKSFGSGICSVSSPQSIRSQRQSKLSTLPLSSAFRGRTMLERCPHYRQFYTGTCGMP